MRSAPDLVVAAALAVSLVGCGDDGGASEGAGESSSGAETGESGEESSSDGEIDEGPWETFAERPCPARFISELRELRRPGSLLTYCTGCHHSGIPDGERQMAPLAVNFDRVQDVRLQIQRVWARAADHNETMPPFGAGDDEERALLGEWLACGAPTDADLAE